MQTWKSLLATSLLLGACGGGGGDDDTAPPDANVVPPDANPVQTRTATIAVTDVALTSAQGAAQGWRGASITAVFEDVTQGGGTVTYGTTPVGGCVVVEYDATHPPHPLVDGGTISMSGDGFLKPVGPCVATDGVYHCVSDAKQDQDVSVAPVGGGAALYTFAEQDFSGQDYVGHYLNINGLTNAGNNSGTSGFPIIAQPTASSFTVVNPTAVTEGTPTPTATGAYVLLNGAGPIPTAALGSDADFLGGAATSITITKGTSDEWGAIGLTTYVRGEGFALADSSARPEAFPATATDPLSFTCMGTGGDCGEDGDGLLEAFIISGKTTDADVSGLPDFIMPPATRWAEFQCGYIIADSGSIPTGALQAILDTNPTRIETRVLRVAGENGTDVANDLNTDFIVVGHGLVGHTSMPPN